ncbi:MAG: 2-hydroxychromene-2-carboxylate isomerase [Beijerinckiaceae bacterium]
MLILHYFSPMSGYSYLGVGALDDLARRRGATVEHRPMDVMKVFAVAGATPPARQSPARLAWRQADMARWAARRGLPVNLKPRFWPVDADLAACAILAAQDAAQDADALAQAILAAVWARDLNIADPDVIGALARECGLDADGLLARARSEATRARYDACTQQAIEAGVFGAPTYVIDGDMFFGQDRLDFVEERLSEALTA